MLPLMERKPDNEPLSLLGTGYVEGDRFCSVVSCRWRRGIIHLLWVGGIGGLFEGSTLLSGGGSQQ